MSDRKEYHAEYYKRRKALRSVPMDQQSTIDPQQPVIVQQQVPQPMDEKTQSEEQKELKKRRPAKPRGQIKPMQHEQINTVNIRRVVYISTLTIFLLANTAFLVNEQVRFFELKGNSTFYSFFVSILSEAAVILLSFFYAQARGVAQKIKLGVLLAFTVATIISIICLGVEKSQSREEKNADISALFKSEIESLKEQALTNPKNTPKVEKKRSFESFCRRIRLRPCRVTKHSRLSYYDFLQCRGV